MKKFYLFLWLRWVAHVSLFSIFISTIISVFITMYLYVNLGSPSLNPEIQEALIRIFIFWFPIVWSFLLFFSLFTSIKYIFNTSISGYELKLLECNSTEVILVIGYGDIIKVWRKWLFLIIWLVVVEIIFGLAFVYILTDEMSLFGWFSIYYLYLFILIAGYFSFILMSSRCKKVRIVKC
ncbi:hypothetical protein JHD48_01065 [Sulfurimonas sp. SAG-AH-194-I05]|nr:hypothetical protein [Sulfurimonas sp. SAG-AH-194-I05]MDF1874318.1 hypothetical protein [Sulfurimonas sp. SAG-AH-194-I05]